MHASAAQRPGDCRRSSFLRRAKPEGFRAKKMGLPFRVPKVLPQLVLGAAAMVALPSTAAPTTSSTASTRPSPHPPAPASSPSTAARSSSSTPTAWPTSRTTSPCTPQTNFRMASVSKQFTAFAVMLLVDRGKLIARRHARQVLPRLPRVRPQDHRPPSAHAHLRHSRLRESRPRGHDAAARRSRRGADAHGREGAAVRPRTRSGSTPTRALRAPRA